MISQICVNRLVNLSSTLRIVRNDVVSYYLVMWFSLSMMMLLLSSPISHIGDVTDLNDNLSNFFDYYIS